MRTIIFLVLSLFIFNDAPNNIWAADPESPEVAFRRRLAQLAAAIPDEPALLDIKGRLSDTSSRLWAHELFSVRTHYKEAKDTANYLIWLEFSTQLPTSLDSVVDDNPNFWRDTARYELVNHYMALGESAKRAKDLVSELEYLKRAGDVYPAGELNFSSYARAIYGRLLLKSDKAEARLSPSELKDILRYLEEGVEFVTSKPKNFSFTGVTLSFGQSCLQLTMRLHNLAELPLDERNRKVGRILTILYNLEPEGELKEVIRDLALTHDGNEHDYRIMREQLLRITQHHKDGILRLEAKTALANLLVHKFRHKGVFEEAQALYEEVTTATLGKEELRQTRLLAIDGWWRMIHHHRIVGDYIERASRIYNLSNPARGDYLAPEWVLLLDFTMKDYRGALEGYRRMLGYATATSEDIINRDAPWFSGFWFNTPEGLNVLIASVLEYQLGEKAQAEALYAAYDAAHGSKKGLLRIGSALINLTRTANNHAEIRRFITEHGLEEVLGAKVYQLTADFTVLTDTTREGQEATLALYWTAHEKGVKGALGAWQDFHPQFDANCDDSLRLLSSG